MDGGKSDHLPMELIVERGEGREGRKEEEEKITRRVVYWGEEGSKRYQEDLERGGRWKSWGELKKP